MNQLIKPMGFNVQTAVNGEEALQKIKQGQFKLIFLDLKMPGLNGMEVLSRIKDEYPDIRTVIITAHGNIESAVEAMKLGAADFIQKPFTPHEIRELIEQILERETLDKEKSLDSDALIELAKLNISERNFDKASQAVRRSIALAPEKPESYNLLGALLEIKGQWLDSQKFYRAALDIDPTFKPALTNLERTTSLKKFGNIDLGSPGNEKKDKPRGDNEASYEK